MEDTVGASRDGLVAEHTARCNDTDGRLGGFHGTNLHTRGVSAKQNVAHAVHVRLLINKEGVLHVAGGMVHGKVQGRKHMVVVLDFGPFHDSETQMRKNLVDVAADNRQRVTRATHLAGRHAHVEASIVSALAFKLLQLFFNLVLNDVLQFVQSHAHLLSELGRHGLEVGKKSRNHTFLAQIGNAEILQSLFTFSLEITHLRQYFFYFLFHFFQL